MYKTICVFVDTSCSLFPRPLSAEKELLVTVGVAGKQPTKGKKLSTSE